MRGFVEPRTLAAAITQRARGPSCTRNYSAGIGRGRGEGLGSYGDTEESIFSSSYGHGAPLNSAAAGRGGSFNAGFSGRGAPLNVFPGAPGLQSGSAPAGRGFGNPNQTDASVAYNGPLLPNISHGRSPREDPFSNPIPPPKPTLNFGSAGFGRGKPLEKVAVPEEIFSSDRRSSLSNWSTWDEKFNKFDQKDDAELRLLGEEENVLRFPAVPQQPRRVGEDAQRQGLPFSASATPLRAAPFQQPPSPSAHGRQPIQQTHMDARVQPQPFPYAAPSTGWQQPSQQSYYDARLQMQPSMRQPPPPTGWQQSAGMGEPYEYTDKQAVSPDLEFGKPYQSIPDGSMEHPSQFSTSARNLTQEAVAMPYPEATYTYNQETKQSGLAETNQQTHAAYSMGDWRIDSTSESMEPRYPSQNFAESNQGQYLHGSEAVQPPSVASDTSSGVSGYEYDWGASFQASKEQVEVEAPVHVHNGSYYDGKIEECFKQGKLEDIDDIYNQMRAAQVRASAKTYGTILQSYMQLGKMDKVSAIYQEMSGVLFSEKNPKETSSTAKGESSTLHQSEGVASSAEMSSAAHGAGYGAEPSAAHGAGYGVESSAAHGASYGAEFEASGGFTPVRDAGKKDTLSSSSNTDAHGFTSFARSGSRAETGMGRGKKVDSFFNFDFSGGKGSGGGIRHGTEDIQVDQRSGSEMHDDYSQTFTPVIEPGWYAFAPQGISVGPGAGRGRGRPQSPQARDLGIGSSMPFPSQLFDSGAGEGRSSYEQRMQVALQQAPPLYSRDVPQYSRDEPAEPQQDFPEEPSLSTEEAAERAMRILNSRYTRLSRRLEDRDEDGGRERRSPVQLAQALREKKQPKKPIKAEKDIQLTEEEAKKEAERLKAIEENETLQELHDTLDQFMKCYGEMVLEPEHELGDFTNPDIEEKPFMPLEEYLEKAKPNIMKTGLIRSEKEWQNMINETLKYAPYFEEFVERYSGPGRYTAKQENDDLEEIASALPSDVGRGAKAFVQRSLTTLKSNPGFNLDEKQWMLATMVDQFSQYPVND